MRRALLKQIQNGVSQLGYHATVPLLLKKFCACRQKFDLDFSVQIFERLGVLIFVRLAWFPVNVRICDR